MKSSGLQGILITGVKDKPIVTLFNKQDLRSDDEPLRDFRADHVLSISAKQNDGLDRVKELLEQLLRENKVLFEGIIPFTEGGLMQQIRKQGELISEEYVAEGVEVKAYLTQEVLGRVLATVSKSKQ